MFVALIAAFGVLMTSDDLAETAATSGLTDALSVSQSGALGFADNGAAPMADAAAPGNSITASSQAFTGQIQDTIVTVAGAGAGFRTGDISFDADSVGGGIQALAVATGPGSLSQSAVSVAAGALTFGAGSK
jgi:hypothetical protein